MFIQFRLCPKVNKNHRSSILGLGRQEFLENYEIFKNPQKSPKKPKICTRCRISASKKFRPL